mgnify:FL=1
MRRTHNVTLTVGEYEKDGQSKKQRVNIGTMMTDDQNGNMSICLKVPPSFKMSEKTGYPEAWLSLFPIDNQQGQQVQNAPQFQQPVTTQQQPQQVQQPQQPQYNPQPQSMQPPAMPQGMGQQGDNDIPFSYNQ